MAPTSQGLKPPANPARFTVCHDGARVSGNLKHIGHDIAQADEPEAGRCFSVQSLMRRRANGAADGWARKKPRHTDGASILDMLVGSVC